MRAAVIELVDGERFGELYGDLGELQGVAESIFGRGQRQPGWFRRKLVREGVEPGLSVVGMNGGAVQGYALLGRAPSLGSIARGAGVGVIAAVRGQGIGRALIDRASARARAAGCLAVEFLAEPERLDWYLEQGFGVVQAQLSLIGFGLGVEAPVVAGVGGRASLGSAPLWAWVPEAWARTPADERCIVELEHGRVWMTREGSAWLAHRLERSERLGRLEHRSADVSVPELLTSLRRRLAVDAPLVLYPCPADAAWVPALLASGFEVAQRSHIVRR